MSTPLIAMLVGAGRFARNYVRVLAQINREAPRGLRPITTVILTRTRRAAARAMAEELGQKAKPPFEKIVGIEVNSRDQLAHALAKMQPGLICLTARDRKTGDNIHAEYAPAALDQGVVLCEKPYRIPAGNGTSLSCLQSLQQHPHAGRFGLHLPMAVVRRAMQAHPDLGPLITRPGCIEFLWQKPKDSHDLLSDLALHPWSLLPHRKTLAVHGVTNQPGRIEIHFKLDRQGEAGAETQGRVVLATGGRFRGMCIDGRVFQFYFDKGRMQVLSLDAHWEQVLAGRAGGRTAGAVLEVDNPLKQHIQAMIDGKPIVGVQETLASQRFLEQAAGFGRWRR